MPKLKITEECEVVRNTAEDIFTKGGSFNPMIGVFNGTEFKGAVILRPVDEEDAEDRACAFAEACMTIGLLRGNTAIISYDSFVMSPDGDQFEAIHVILATERGAEAYMMPYSRNEDGRFQEWLKDKEQDDIDPNGGISNNMLQTLAHFMHSGAELSYPEIMLRSLSKKGHMITLPGGKSYAEGILSVEENSEQPQEQRA